jgi:hypothetical protein
MRVASTVRTALATALALFAGAAGAQDASRTVEGRVVRPGGRGTVGVQGSWVVLHRVGSDRAGPLDSVRTGADGGFRFRYVPVGDTAAVYFVSTTRGGVAYFTGALREAAVRGGAADMLVYDTTSAPIPIRVAGRHIIVTAPDTARPEVRTIVEIYEVSNDSTVTRVSRGGPTFEAPLPRGVEAVAAGDGDISGEALALVDGRVHVTAPLAPGVKQFSFSYDLPVRSEVIEFRVESAVPVLEVLVEDARGGVSGAGLVAVQPVVIDGRPLQRYLAEAITDTASFTVRAPGPDTSGLRLMLIVTAVGAALLLGLGLAFLRGGPRAFARQRNQSPESLALAVAALDAEYERLASPTDEQKRQHHVARMQLKGRLSAALARRDGLG